MATTETSRHVQRFLTRSEGLLAEQTYRTRKSDMNNFEDWLDDQGIDITDVDALDIEDYVIDQSNEGYAAGTVNKRFYSVKKLYEYLDDKIDVIDETPFENVDRGDLSRLLSGTRKHEETREEISYITPDEIDTLCEHVPEPRLRNELMIRLMFQTGVRQGELVGIRLQDIDTDERSIRIHAEKTHTNRTVYYQPSLDFILDRWINGGYRAASNYAEQSAYLFPSRQSEQLTDHKVNWMVKEAAENADMQDIMYVDKSGNERNKLTSHQLRHSHAIQCIKSGIDIERVRRHMGHSSLDMTQKYLQFVADDVGEAMKKFSDQ